MSKFTQEMKAKLAMDSLIDSCKILADLSGGVEHANGYDAYFAPETFWYHRVNLLGEGERPVEEVLEEIAARVRAGELPPLLSWCGWEHNGRELRRKLMDLGYVPVVEQIAMFKSLEDYTPWEGESKVVSTLPEEVEEWSKRTADYFQKPPEVAGLMMIADHKDCDFFSWKEDGEMLGGTLLICQGENAGIHEVSTHPQHRGKGYAKALMHKAFTLATAKGCKYATLQASPMGYPLYLSIGMEEVGSIQNWIMPPRD